eukprot:TRINITY_DN1566_c0_g1_i2.p1 TRINITY_DN1566_c0_g1~~TRINITY_DN1566_c0_g1_i2.p1  ORF type:complete len:198 (-),score=8.10 TRINITY_DN1566_c0_g1_i2:58-651(-)
MKTFYPLGKNFFEFVNPTPDLYGPFWITTTVIFLMAATGNVANWFVHAIDDEPTTWNYDFTKITTGALTIYCYFVFIPLILWLIGKYWMEINLSLTEHMCAYGYAFFVFIPTTFIMLLPPTKFFEWLRWVIMIFAALVSTFFLVYSYYPPFKPAFKKGFVVLIAMTLAQIGLAVVLKVFFFTYIPPISPIPVNLTSA